ncbi:Lsr2 family DNA-binding protein [Streptomyces lincolnensis]|uniref:Lsr2 family DNA-binding protein n=1 Tax=Streptomyces lincolnensis TaxID=1915 RepID=UPI0037CEA76F
MFNDWKQALEAEGLPLDPTTTEQEAAAARVAARHAGDKEDLVLLLDVLGLPGDDDTLTALLPLLPEDGDPDDMTTETPNAFEAMALSMHSNGDSTDAIISATGLSDDELTELLAAHGQAPDTEAAPEIPAAVTETAVTETVAPAVATEADTLDPGALQDLLAWADEQATAAVRNRAARIRTDWAELIQRRAIDEVEGRVAKLKSELEQAQDELRAIKAGTLPVPAAAPALEPVPVPDTAPAVVAAAPTPIRPAMGSGRTPEQLAAVRAWARANGYTVADKGMIKKAILDAYDAAQQAPAAKAS